MLHDKIHIHDCVNFDHTVTKNMEIGDLKSYIHDLINILVDSVIESSSGSKIIRLFI